MRNTTRTTALVSTALLIAAATPALAHDRGFGDDKFDHELWPVQTAEVSAASGDARVRTLPDGRMRVMVRVDGLTPGVHHMQHLHGFPAMADMGCPSMAMTPEADADMDGLISVGEGVPWYGPVQVHLNTTGPVTAPDDYAMADANGRLRYERTFEASEANLAMAGRFQVVVHGIDLDGDGMLMGAMEMSIPAVCGGVAN